MPTPKQAQGKSQAIRVLDVLLIGPLMIYSALALMEARKQRDWTSGLLAVFGIATVLYNARNWWRLRS